MSSDNSKSKDAGKSSTGKGLQGLMPYLRRYPGAIVFGLLMVVLMGIIGNILPLATGVMTDTLAGNPVPFEHSAEPLEPGPLDSLLRTEQPPHVGNLLPYRHPLRGD
jgi:hypothetical protein